MNKLLALSLLAVPGVASAESYVPDVIVQPVDVLVVMDSAPAAAGARAALADRISGFVTDLEARFPSDYGDSSRVSLQVGFVTGDLGAGALCGAGDGARLQIASTACFTTAAPYPWVISDTNRWGEASGNIVGTAAEAVRCAMPVTFDDGCAFQQPLRAAVAALDGDVAVNGGFLRDEAVLAVLFVSTQDDCSAIDPQFWEPDATGPATPYRCAEEGWACTADGCVARDDSPWLTHPTEIADALRALKSDPSRIVVGTIRGEPTPVDLSGGVVHPSCGAGTDRAATPALRLDAVAAQFPGSRESVCDDLSLTGFVDAIATAAEPVEPVDSDSDYDPPECDGGFGGDEGGAPAEASGSDGGCSASGSGGTGALLLLSLLAAATARRGCRRDR